MTDRRAFLAGAAAVLAAPRAVQAQQSGKAYRIGYLGSVWNPANPVAESLRRLEAAARTLNVRLQRHDVRTGQDVEAAFAVMTKDRVEAAIVMDDVFVYQQRHRIGNLALQHRLPTVSSQRSFPEAGLLMSYGASFVDLFRRAAVYVDRILRGAKPAELPVEQPTIFELVINVKTAKALGVTIPPSLLKRTDQVIE